MNRTHDPKEWRLRFSAFIAFDTIEKASSVEAAFWVLHVFLGDRIFVFMYVARGVAAKFL